MRTMVKIANVMLLITAVIAAVALTVSLSSAWLAYVPYVNLAVGYASPIFWRCLVSMFWWVVLRWFFKKISKREDNEDT